MNIEFEITPTEAAACFSGEVDFSKAFEVKIGNETFTCYIQQYSSGKIAAGWTTEPATWVVRAQGHSKRLREITEAKALVNKTKEAHKEAQRKLSELQEGSK